MVQNLTPFSRRSQQGRGSWTLGRRWAHEAGAPTEGHRGLPPGFGPTRSFPGHQAAVPWFSKTRSRGNPRPVDRRVGANPVLPLGSCPHLLGLPRGLRDEDVTATHPDPQGRPRLGTDPFPEVIFCTKVKTREEGSLKEQRGSRVLLAGAVQEHLAAATRGPQASICGRDFAAS